MVDVAAPGGHRAWADLGEALLGAAAGEGDGGSPVGTPVESAREAFVASLPLASPFSIIAANAHLDAHAAEVLAVLCTVEIGNGRARLTLGELAALWPAATTAALGAVAPEGALIRAALVSVAPEGRWAGRAVSVAPSVCWALVGDCSPDPGLSPDVALVSRPAAAAGRSGRGKARQDDLNCDRSLLVVGADRQRRRELALAHAAGLRFLVGPPPCDDAGWAALVRQATLQGAGIIVELETAPDETARRWLAAARHLVWVLSSRNELPLETLGDHGWRERWASDSPATLAEWHDIIGERPLAAHGLGADQLRLVARALPLVGGDPDAAVRRLASGAIDTLARRIRPDRSWDDLVVPAERRMLLGDLALRFRAAQTVRDSWGHRGRRSGGVVGLFHGPSGTGKTLSAEIVAHELGLDLFAIDLAAVVSKYIGETEKNLEQVFQAAAAGRVVLLFDEADAIFGERSKTQDAHDRYANLEVSYLLQRIEAYSGVAILTTNLMNNIDQAFLRRIDVAVEFTLPEPDERRALWRCGFPPRAPLDGVDLDFLARQFKLPGGAIHNVALTSAYLAADAQTAITMETVMAAMAREYAKLGRLRTVEEFGPYFDLVR